MYSASFDPSWSTGQTPGFPDPFADAASLAMPDGMSLALRWAEFLVTNQGLYRKALERVVSYFLTEVDVIGDIGDDEKEKYKEFLEDELGVYQVLQEVGMDYLTYNNAYVSVFARFDRSFRCPGRGCGHDAPFRRIVKDRRYHYSWRNHAVHATCPHCGYSGDWGAPVDRKTDSIRVKRWNPHDMIIQSDHDMSGDKAYIWKIPAEYRRKITRGDAFELERAPWGVVQAVKNGFDFRFQPDAILHLSHGALAGLRVSGHGIPDPINNFRQSYRTATLERYNEAICQDYIVPFRVLTPTPNGGGHGVNPLELFPAHDFTSRVNNMLRRRRIDPAAWFVLPFGLDYKALGGEARNLAPKELLDQAYETLMLCAGVPVELFKGTLQVQAAPAALRLFEASWSRLVRALNLVLDFLAKRLARLLSWEVVKLKLRKVSLVDDLQKVQERLQLGVGGVISQTSALEAVGLKFREESRKKKEEEKFQAELQEEFQQEQDGKALAMQMAMPAQPGQPGRPGIPADPSQAGGAVPPGQAAPADPSQVGVMQAMQSPMGMSGKYSPQDMMAVAQQQAGQMLAMPEGQRQSQMMQLKQQNPTMWSLVRAQIDQTRNRAKTQGGQMLLQQQFGGQ